MKSSIHDMTEAYNQSAVDDFEGFTPNEMWGLLHTPFDVSKSCMRLNDQIDERALSDSYFTGDVKTYLKMVCESQPMKLTANGNLPRQFCRNLMAEGVGKTETPWLDEQKLMREEDSFYITLIDNYTRIIGMTKKERGHVSITGKGSRMLEARSSDFYLFLFKTYCTRLNWGCSDSYPVADIIQASFPFSVYLVQKYGGRKLGPEFYVEKFIRAYPSSLAEFAGTPRKKEDDILGCYCTRVFERFMRRFGLITIYARDHASLVMKEYEIQKNGLMDELILWERASIRDVSIQRNEGENRF